MKQIKVNFKVPDQDLTEGFIQNDRKCMEQIYAQNYKSVEMYILQNSGKEADAKDIYQEAIVAAWINVKEGKFELQGGKAIGGYIFQIAKFKWLDKLKSKAHRSTVRLVHENQSEETSDDDYNEEDDSRMQYLTELYKNLDEKCKAILNRFYYQKMSLEEIGSELDHDPGTVKTLKYRCMKKLRSFHTNNIS